MCVMSFVITQTHNQIEKLSGIVMSPSGIESTSLLLAHGIGKLVLSLFHVDCIGPIPAVAI